ncbi:RimK family alpha-L-glutamate ligase [Streptomyces sp. NBC_01497]|uniref:RimK family alpha-L-glutamate ligase n=1 Tax=Streptomyces sp. NBC_01497 TaxID=2903885 RepID=UPI002E337C46|nr:RimK family alpha-L-glutamate ligase [Streptomyces sp. NBC_01497]
MRPTPAPRTALLASRVRFEEKRILEALDRRGIPRTLIDARTVHQHLDDGRPPWDLVLNREISATRALYAALTFEAMGVPVLDSAAAVETCGDKWRTSLALRAAGIPTPPAALALTAEAGEEAAERLGYPVVLKPLVGSWGRRVALLPDAAALRTVLEYCDALPSPQAKLVYLQSYVDKPDRDIRVIVVGGTPIGAVYRRSDEWRTNVARGSTTEPCELTPDIAAPAAAAAKETGAQIAGVDLVEDRDGRPYVLEVNHGVEFKGFQHAHGDRTDVAQEIVDRLVLEVNT